MTTACALLVASLALLSGCGRCVGQDDTASSLVFEKSVALEGASSLLASTCSPSDDQVPHVSAAKGARLVETVAFVWSEKHPSSCPTPTDRGYYCSHEDEASRKPAVGLGDPTCLSVEGDDPAVLLDSAESIGQSGDQNGFRLTFVVRHSGPVKLADAKGCGPGGWGGTEFFVDSP